MDVPEDVFLAVVRARVSEARRSRGLTQEDAAHRSGLSVRGYQALEAVSGGRRFNPGLATLRVVARALETTIGELAREPSPEEVAALERPPRVRRVPGNKPRPGR